MRRLDIQELIDKVVNGVSEKRNIDSDFNLLETNGMLLDAVAMTAENSTYNMYEAEKERFVVTAEKRNSLVKHGGSSDLDLNLIRPAKMNMMLMLRLEEVLADADLIDGVYRYTIDKNTEVTIGNKYFSFDYDIQVSIFENKDGTYSVSSRYILDTENTVSDIRNPNIITTRYNSTIGEIISLDLKLHQYRRKYVEFSYVSKINSRNFKTSFTDHLVDFNVWYQKDPDSNSDLIKLDKSLFLQDIKSNQRTIFYEHLDDNSFVIMNRYSMGNFYPVKGSKFIIEIITSLGEDGNFEYTGNYITANNNHDNVVLRLQPSSNSIGGVDPLGLEDMRERIIMYKSTKDAITSVDDMIKKLSQFGDPYKVIKYRNDVRYRIYNVFTLLRDNNNYTIPTNTSDIILDLTEMIKEEDSYMLPEMKTFYQHPNEINMSPIEDTHQYLFPYSLVYNKTNNHCKVFEGIVDRLYKTEYTYINNNVKLSYMVNEVLFQKVPDKNYTLSFDLKTNSMEPVDFIHSIDGDTGEIVDAGYIMTSMAIYYGKILQGYIDMDLTSYDDKRDTYHYNKELPFESIIKPTGEVDLQLKDPVTGVNKIVSVSVDKLRFELMVHSTDDIDDNYTDPLNNIRDGVLVNIFEFQADMLKDMTYMVRPQIVNVTSDIIKLKLMPLVSQHYLSNNPLVFNSVINGKQDVLGGMLYELEDDSEFSLLFVNSYGVSNIYYIGLNGSTLDQTNLSMSFNMRLQTGVQLDKSDIRKFITNYLQNIEFLDYKDFHISRLIKELKISFEEIDFIEFVGVNDYDSSKQFIAADISKIDNSSVPEYLNISRETNNNQLEININYV